MSSDDGGVGDHRRGFAAPTSEAGWGDFRARNDLWRGDFRGVPFRWFLGWLTATFLAFGVARPGFWRAPAFGFDGRRLLLFGSFGRTAPRRLVFFPFFAVAFRPAALPLGHRESFWNLDSFAINVVLLCLSEISEPRAQRHQRGWALAAYRTLPATEPAGRPDTAPNPVIERRRRRHLGLPGCAGATQGDQWKAMAQVEGDESPTARRRRPDRPGKNTVASSKSTITAFETSRKARSSRAPCSR